MTLEMSYHRATSKKPDKVTYHHLKRTYEWAARGQENQMAADQVDL